MSKPEPRGQAAPAVLQVVPRLATGGAERGTVDVAAALVAAGGRALVASAGGRLVAELEARGGRHVGLPLAAKNPLTILRNAGRLRGLIRAEGIDIVHARSRAPAWSAWLACRWTRTPFVTTFHAVYNFRSGAKKAYNSVMAKGDRVIAISQAVADHVARTYGVPPDRLRLINRGTDFATFDPAAVTPERVARLAQDWNVPPGRPVILMPGRLARWKGQGTLIAALARLRRPDLVALIVGSDQGRDAYRQDLEQAIAAAGLDGQVRLTGHCDDMAAAYALADLVLHLSTEPEGFGRTVVEAQGMGRPVIASDLGGPRETVLSGTTGWLIPPGDPAALAAAIARALAQTPDQRSAMGRAAMAFVRPRFSLAAMTGATLALYRELAPARSAPEPGRPP